MAHLALYREFRPKNFDEVVGQDHIVKTLTHQIATDSVSHAYLFCGTRGTGKTSCAKIFAKAVNCLNPKNGSPCGECEVCKKIDSNGNLDIIEIDAASNNRVDEIRDLREKVGYLPTIGKYKVYIIDEVHMLTDSAFNALLKTLEEPPAHIIFILATTEPEKLPATILSRCMKFDFKLVEIDDLVCLLEKIFERIGVKYEDDALRLIAKAGNGSVRDTLSIAEMCKSYAENNITLKSVGDCLGFADESIINDLAVAIIQKNGERILTQLDGLYRNGKNLNVVIGDLCEFFRNTLTLKLANNFDLKVSTSVKENYQKVAQSADEKTLLDILKKLCDGMAEVKFASNVRIFTETLLLSLFYNDNLELQLIKDRLSNLENGISQQEVKKNDIEQKQNKAPENTFATQSEIIETSLSKFEVVENTNNVFENKKENISKENKQAKNIFGEFIGHLRNQGEMLLLAGLRDIKNVDIQNGKFIFLCLTQDMIDMLNNHKSVVLEFLKKYNINDFETKVFVDSEKQIDENLKNLLDGKIVFND